MYNTANGHMTRVILTERIRKESIYITVRSKTELITEIVKESIIYYSAKRKALGGSLLS